MCVNSLCVCWYVVLYIPKENYYQKLWNTSALSVAIWLEMASSLCHFQHTRCLEEHCCPQQIRLRVEGAQWSHWLLTNALGAVLLYFWQVDEVKTTCWRKKWASEWDKEVALKVKSMLPASWSEWWPNSNWSTGVFTLARPSLGFPQPPWASNLFFIKKPVNLNFSAKWKSLLMRRHSHPHEVNWIWHLKLSSWVSYHPYPTRPDSNTFFHYVQPPSL